MDHEKPTGPARNLPASGSEADLAQNPSVDDFFRRLKQDLHHPKPGNEAIAAALQAVQRLASQVDTDASAAPRPKLPCPVLVSPAAVKTRRRTGSAPSAAFPSRMPHPLNQKLRLRLR